VRIALVLIAFAACHAKPPANTPDVCVGWHCRKPSTEQTTRSKEPLPNPGETGELRGTITGDDNGGAPLAGVMVVATSPVLPSEVAVSTDDKGAWAIPDLAPGTYEVRFAYANNSIVASSVEVERGQASVFRTINFPMDPTRGYE
jgi:hypothetical protein